MQCRSTGKSDFALAYHPSLTITVEGIHDEFMSS